MAIYPTVMKKHHGSNISFSFTIIIRMINPFCQTLFREMDFSSRTGIKRIYIGNTISNDKAASCTILQKLRKGKKAGGG